MYPLRFSIHHVPQKEKSHHRHSSKLLLVKPQGLCRGEFYYSPATDSASIAGYDGSLNSAVFSRTYRLLCERVLQRPYFRDPGWRLKRYRDAYSAYVLGWNSP